MSTPEQQEKSYGLEINKLLKQMAGKFYAFDTKIEGENIISTFTNHSSDAHKPALESRLEDAGMLHNRNGFLNNSSKVTLETLADSRIEHKYEFTFPNTAETVAKLQGHRLTGIATRLSKAHDEFNKEIAEISTPATQSINTSKAFVEAGNQGLDLEKLSKSLKQFSEQKIAPHQR